MQSFTLVQGQQADEAVVKEVLSYFVRNPYAADSLEGITRWRLLDEVVRRRLEETERALEWLVERNFLTKALVVGRGPVFSINQDKLSEAQTFISAAQRGGTQKKG
jgi:hypothetical protein